MKTNLTIEQLSRELKQFKKEQSEINEHVIKIAQIQDNRIDMRGESIESLRKSVDKIADSMMTLHSRLQVLESIFTDFIDDGDTKVHLH